MKINLYLTPLPFSRQELADKTVVVIDVLRCTTSICKALDAGARAVIPTDGQGEAGDIWSNIGSGNAILAGEQDGVKIENFNLGNSPAEYTTETVGGKFVIMATTNGTPLLKKSQSAALVLSASFVNMSAVCEQVKTSNQDIIIACSGRAGHYSVEDTLCGGMIIEHLLAHASDRELNDAGKLACLLYRENKNRLSQAVHNGEHGRFLKKIGFGEDISLAMAIDSIPVVPVMVDGQLLIKNE